MTPRDFEAELDRTLRGDQGAAQRLIDHNKRMTAMQRDLDAVQDALGVPVVSSRPLACYVQDLKSQLAGCKGWQTCETHGAIHADVAWGCPDCVRELRSKLGDAQDIVKQLRETILYITQERETQP